MVVGPAESLKKKPITFFTLLISRASYFFFNNAFEIFGF